MPDIYRYAFLIQLILYSLFLSRAVLNIDTNIVFLLLLYVMTAHNCMLIAQYEKMYVGIGLQTLINKFSKSQICVELYFFFGGGVLPVPVLVISQRWPLLDDIH